MVQSKDQPQASFARMPVPVAWLSALVPAATLLALLFHRVWDVDIFWQLKLGELILARHGPLRAEPFAALHLGEPLPSVAWLGQAVMAGVRLIGGWGLLRLVDALCWLGGFWVVAAACRMRGASRGAVMLALLLAFATAEQTASIRPQSFAVLCLGALLALQRLELRPVVTVILGAPLLVGWQNLHPSESVGVTTAGVGAVLDVVAWLRDRKSPFRWANMALALIGTCAIFATPDGFSIIAVSVRNAESSMAIGASEWLPLWIPDNRENALRVLAVASVVAVLVLRNRARADVRELAVTVALLLLTLTAYRFVVFWAVTIVPVVARVTTTPGQGRRGVDLPRGAVVLPVLAVAALGLIFIPTRFDPFLPLAAVERLKQERLRGTVYADFPFGGAIIDGGYPAWRVAYDGRYYRYSRDEWKYNGGIENGYVPLVDVVQKWRPVAFILNARHNAPLAGELARSRDWRRIYAQAPVVVYVPRGR